MPLAELAFSGIGKRCGTYLALTSQSAARRDVRRWFHRCTMTRPLKLAAGVGGVIAGGHGSHASSARRSAWSSRRPSARGRGDGQRAADACWKRPSASGCAKRQASCRPCARCTAPAPGLLPVVNDHDWLLLAGVMNR